MLSLALIATVLPLLTRATVASAKQWHAQSRFFGHIHGDLSAAFPVISRVFCDPIDTKLDLPELPWSKKVCEDNPLIKLFGSAFKADPTGTLVNIGFDGKNKNLDTPYVTREHQIHLLMDIEKFLRSAKCDEFANKMASAACKRKDQLVKKKAVSGDLVEKCSPDAGSEEFLEALKVGCEAIQANFMTAKSLPKSFDPQNHLVNLNIDNIRESMGILNIARHTPQQLYDWELYFKYDKQHNQEWKKTATEDFNNIKKALEEKLSKIQDEADLDKKMKQQDAAVLEFETKMNNFYLDTYLKVPVRRLTGSYLVENVRKKYEKYDNLSIFMSSGAYKSQSVAEKMLMAIFCMNRESPEWPALPEYCQKKDRDPNQALTSAFGVTLAVDQFMSPFPVKLLYKPDSTLNRHEMWLLAQHIHNFLHYGNADAIAESIIFMIHNGGSSLKAEGNLKEDRRRRVEEATHGTL